MLQRIKLLTSECCENLLTFQNNDDLKVKYEHPNYDETHLVYLKMQAGYFIEDDLTLGVSVKDDCQNSIEIFKQLRLLDKVQANDKRLWVSLTHSRFYNYVWQRWNFGLGEISESKIKDRYHFEGSGINARTGNAISRLWWTAKVTYDKERDDEFELTRVIWEKQDLWTGLMERSFSTYPNVVQGFLEFYKLNKQLKEDEIRFMQRGLNAIGGVKMLPLLSKQEIIDELRQIADFSKIQVA